jgi:ABC-type nickel/cobalt efflux system permease component RcnA
MLEWLAALVVLVIGGWGIWQLVQRSIKEHEAWAKQERFRYMMEMNEYDDDIDIPS